MKKAPVELSIAKRRTEKKAPVELSIAKRRTENNGNLSQPSARDLCRKSEYSHRGCNVAGSARREIEQRTGQPVVSPLNATDKLALDTSVEDVKQIETNAHAGRSGK